MSDTTPETPTCQHCKGDGSTIEPAPFPIEEMEATTCPECNGTGRAAETPTAGQDGEQNAQRVRDFLCGVGFVLSRSEVDHESTQLLFSTPVASVDVYPSGEMIVLLKRGVQSHVYEWTMDELPNVPALLVDALADQLAQAQGEVRQAEDIASSMSNTIANIGDTCRARGFEAPRQLDERVIAMAQDLDRLRAENAELSRNLHEYGEHQVRCIDGPECTCGWADVRHKLFLKEYAPAALAKHQPEQS